MASHTYSTRLQREYKALMKEPVPNIVARPSSNILEWHYIITGPAGTPYEEGEYHGVLKFTTEYPMKPPSIVMVTPSGRFEPNTRLCLSMSDYHPESWNPMWSVGSILTGLLSFMLEETRTTGSISSTTEEKRRYALVSRHFNRRNKAFQKMFPELCTRANEAEAATPPGSPATPTAAPSPDAPAAAPAPPPPPTAAPPSVGADPRLREYLLAFASVSAVLVALLVYAR